MITIVNKHTHISSPYDFYCGRGSILGNPFTSKSLNKTKAQFQCKTPEESIEKYKEYLIDKINNKDKEICDELNRLYELARTGYVINLVCYCVTEKNNICHGNVIKEIIESKL